MAGNLNPGFVNNINIISIHSNAGGIQKITDRKIDFDGDGVKEVVSIVNNTSYYGSNGTTISKDVVTKPSGIARTVVDLIIEKDNGLDVTGSPFTQGFN